MAIQETSLGISGPYALDEQSMSPNARAAVSRDGSRIARIYYRKILLKEGQRTHIYPASGNSIPTYSNPRGAPSPWQKA